MALQLGPRTRRIARYAGIAVLAVIVFVFALQMTFPYGRVKDKIEDALSEKYEVSIGDVERGLLPGRVYFKAVSLRTRAKPDEPVTTFYIEKLEVDLGIFALLRGVASVDLDAKIGAGHIKGNVSIGKKGTNVHFDGTDLPGASLPMRAALGLPMTGKLDFAVALDLPNERNKAGRVAADWTKAEGSFEFSCPTGCTFGDGKTKLKPLLKNSRNQAMVGDGIDFGQVNIDSMFIKATITPGEGTSKPAKMELTRFDAKSQDGELKVDYMMTLAPDINDSIVDGCLRFKGSETLRKREPKTHAAIQTTGAELRSDGMFHIKLTDKLRDMKRLNMECGPGAKVNNGENFAPHQATRPNLTVQPDEPIKPPLTPAVPPPPPVAQPPAPTPATPANEQTRGARPPGPEGEQPPVPLNPSVPAQTAPPEGAGTAGAGGAGGSSAGQPVRRN